MKHVETHSVHVEVPTEDYTPVKSKYQKKGRTVTDIVREFFRTEAKDITHDKRGKKRFKPTTNG
jgi:hypothetical protein